MSISSYIQKIKVFSSFYSVYILAFLVSVVAIVNVIGVLNPNLPERFLAVHDQFPLTLRAIAQFFIILASFNLLILADGLTKRKRIAWLLTIFILALSSLLLIMAGLFYKHAIITTLLIVLLLFSRYYFHQLSTGLPLLRGIAIFMMAIVFIFFYASVGLMLSNGYFEENLRFINAVYQIFLLVTHFSMELTPINSEVIYFTKLIYLSAFVIMFYVIAIILSILIANKFYNDKDKIKAQKIIQAYGNNILAHFLLSADKSYFFSKQQVVIGYVIRNNIALALGDPVGSKEAIPDSIREFKNYCMKNNWKIVFYQVSEDYLQDYLSLDLFPIKIGQEGVVDIKELFQQEIYNVLKETNENLSKVGLYCKTYTPPLEASIIHKLQDVSDAWLHMINIQEQCFSAGWFDKEYIQSKNIIALHSVQGEVLAFASLLKSFDGKEVSLDLVRYRSDLSNDMMDMLFFNIFQWIEKENYSYCNIGLAPLGGVEDQATDYKTAELLARLYGNFYKFYYFRKFHIYREKFNPAWHAKYIIAMDLFNMHSILIALVSAQAGSDFFLKLYNFLFKR